MKETARLLLRRSYRKADWAKILLVFQINNVITVTNRTGAFEVPTDIVTPMKLEGQRLIQEE